MRKSYIYAIIIAALIVLWLGSGQLGDAGVTSNPTLSERNRQSHAAGEDRPPTPVRVRLVEAEPRVTAVTVRGRTENKRTVSVRAETTGRVIERPVDRGSRIEAGGLLCRLSADDREARLQEARENVNQARVDYDGSLKLSERGLQSESQIASARARLAAAEALQARIDLDLERTTIRAPFTGIVDDVEVEVGDFVQPGAVCATVIDLDPMLLVGRVAERDVGRVARATTAEAILPDGTRVEGRLTFVGNRSDDATRTYPIEIEVDNADHTLRSGITAHIRIPVETRSAHRVSPALLALDDAGRVGIRTLNSDDRVVFHPVDIISDDGGAVWISGLPEVVRLITVGQELVVPGERVQTVDDSEAPARASDNSVGRG